MNTELILTIYTAIVIFCNVLWWLVCCPVSCFDVGLRFLNPLYIYDNTKLNWFGTILVCIIANLAFGPASLLYWLYKLCTFGRK